MSSANLHQGGRDGWIEGGGTEEVREGGMNGWIEGGEEQRNGGREGFRV